jgi:hypothetical protein
MKSGEELDIEKLWLKIAGFRLFKVVSQVVPN